MPSRQFRPSRPIRQAPQPARTRSRCSADAAPFTVLSRSSRSTQQLGRAIGKALRGGEVIGLHGDLGAGKTTLVRGIAAGLDATPSMVSSPTFVLIHEYVGRVPLAHVDLYRIRSEAELATLGLSEYLNGRTVVVVEWASRAGSELGRDHLAVSLSHRTERTRIIRLAANGSRSAILLALIVKLHHQDQRRPARGRRHRPPRTVQAGAA